MIRPSPEVSIPVPISKMPRLPSFIYGSLVDRHRMQGTTAITLSIRCFTEEGDLLLVDDT